MLVNDGVVAFPPVHRDLPAADISGRTSSALKTGLGLSILSDVLAAMGGSPLGLDAAYGKAARISFEFRDVVEDRVGVAMLDRYLSSADLNTHTTHAGQLLESDDLYVVTSTLKSDRVVVRAWHEQGSVDIDVPMLREILGGRIGVSATGTGEQQITYAGSDRLVFGFQAFRMRYVNGAYRAPAAAPKVSMRGDDTTGDDVLRVEAPFVRIGD